MRLMSCIFFLVGLFVTALAFGGSCRFDVPDQLFILLKPKLSWVDINSWEPFAETCTLTIRYYPCMSLKALQVKEALLSITPGCQISISAQNKQIDDYCQYESVHLDC